MAVRRSSTTFVTWRGQDAVAAAMGLGMSNPERAIEVRWTMLTPQDETDAQGVLS